MPPRPFQKKQPPKPTQKPTKADQKPAKRRRWRNAYRIYGGSAGAVTVLLFLAGVVGLLWPVYLIWLAVLSIVTFAYYALDKFLSRGEGRLRVPELVLYALSVLGGFMGGSMAMVLLRHKTAPEHWRFQVAQGMGLVLYLGTVWWFWWR